jgi:20S proteasome alpha/beta subunit
MRWVTNTAAPKARRAPLGSLSARAQSILDRSGNEDMSMEAAMRLARAEVFFSVQRG